MKTILYHLTSLTLLIALAAGCTGVSPLAPLEEVMQAIAPLRSVAAAEAAGYAQFLDCVSEHGMGAMGIHYVNGDLVGDAVIDPLRPEALIFEPKGDAKEFVGVEYVVFKEAWDAEHDMPPSLMNHTFGFTDSPNRYDLPPFYSIHLWLGRGNPSGIYASWNPNVMCPQE